MARYYCDYCKSYIKNDSVHPFSTDLSSRAEAEKNIFAEASIAMLLLSTTRKYVIHTLFATLDFRTLQNDLRGTEYGNETSIIVF